MSTQLNETKLILIDLLTLDNQYRPYKFVEWEPAPLAICRRSLRCYVATLKYWSTNRSKLTMTVLLLRRPMGLLFWMQLADVESTRNVTKAMTRWNRNWVRGVNHQDCDFFSASYKLIFVRNNRTVSYIAVQDLLKINIVYGLSGRNLGMRMFVPSSTRLPSAVKTHETTTVGSRAPKNSGHKVQ